MAESLLWLSLDLISFAAFVLGWLRARSSWFLIWEFIIVSGCFHGPLCRRNKEESPVLGGIFGSFANLKLSWSWLWALSKSLLARFYQGIHVGMKNLPAAVCTPIGLKKEPQLQQQSTAGRRSPFAPQLNRDFRDGMLLWRGIMNVQLAGRWSNQWKLLFINARKWANPIVKICLGYFGCLSRRPQAAPIYFDEYWRKMGNQLTVAKGDQQRTGALKSTAANLGSGRAEAELTASVMNKRK